MRRNINRKSQGNIIVIILVIVIVLAGIVVVLNIIYPMISEKSREADTSLFNINLNIKEVFISETGASKVTVQRGSGEGEISSLKFIFYDEDGQSYTNSENTNMPNELETKTYFFSPFANLKKLKSVSVVPVVNNKLGTEYKFNYRFIYSISPGLISWWKFNDVSDSIGNNQGTLINNAQISNGNLVLSGSEDYMNIGNDNSLDMNSQFAISVWIKPSGSYGGEILSKGTNYAVSIDNDGKIKFSYGNGYSDKSLQSIPLNTMSHIVVSIDWNGIWKIYIDGELDNSGNTNANTIINSENAKIGNRFKGEIEDIMLFNKILTQENVQFLYINQLS